MEDSSQQRLAITFPKTHEEFDKVEFLSTTMKRIELIRWMDEMLETHIGEGHCDREKFLFFAKTMRLSFSETSYLYKIQGTINLDNVLSGGSTYEVLFKVHKFWTTITTEFEEIFSKYSLSNRYKLFILLIPRKPLSERPIQIIQAIATNENLMNIMIELQESLKIILTHIQFWESPQELNYKLLTTTGGFDKVKVLSTTNLSIEDLSVRPLVNTFPKTRQEFEKVDFLSTKMARIDLIRWMEEMLETHINESHCDRKKFLFFTKTMRSSFSNTYDLYKIQAKINLDKKISKNVLPGNSHYKILFQAHEFWTALTTEFEEIFIKYSLLDRYKSFILQIPRKLLSEKPIQIIQAIAINENLMNIMIQLQENIAIIISHIQLWKSSQKPATELLVKTFPKTTEEFNNVNVLSTSFLRIDLVKWMDEMVKTHISDSHCDKEKFLWFAKTMKLSLSNTNYLYKIQTAINLDEKIHNNKVELGNVFYDILFQAHEFWTAITNEFQSIFIECSNTNNQHASSIIQIPKNPLSGIGLLVILSIVSNENLMEVIKKLQENSEIILGHIQSWEAQNMSVR